jgi:histidine triad (HIT) family protein
MDCLFCKIISGNIPADIQYQNENIIAFKDIYPQAPVHTLIVPRQHFNTLNDLSLKECSLMGEVIYTAKILAKQYNIDDSGYRLIMNCNAGGGQSIFHIHAHLLGGKSLKADKLI